MSHTPGPLRINDQAIMLGRRNIGRAFVTPETDAVTTRDNARLWGTAPELLKALKGAVSNLRMAQVLMDSASRAICQSILKDYEAVIAKATGGNS